jgi:ATP-binding cassette, subfamily B (MDR/TAP), member 1
MWIVFFGFFFEIVKGLISTTFGALIMKNFFSILNNYNDYQKMRDDVDFWSLMKFITAIVAFICCFSSKALFSRVGENITLNVRSDLYTQIVKKQIGWHDDASNASGILGAILASDVQLLNGASAEGVAVMAEAIFSLVWGCAIGFFFCWKVALIALALTPLIIIGAAISAKIQKSDMVNNKDAKMADLLASDSISNYRTVASFSINELIVQEYEDLLQGPYDESQKNAHVSGFVFGYSQFITNIAFAVLFYFGTVFMLNDRTLTGEEVFVAIFAMFFGAYAAG